MFLQQCREIRNNASIAHPTNIKITANEMVNFIDRCCVYGLANAKSGKGVELKEVIEVIGSDKTTDDSINALARKIIGSFELQQKFFIKILYEKFINPTENTYVRNNALKLSKKLKSVITESIDSDFNNDT